MSEEWLPPAFTAFALVLVLGLLAVLFLTRPRIVMVNDQVELKLTPSDVEQRAFGRLGSIPGCQMKQSSVGQLSLVTSTTPGWAIFFGILTLPIGLLLIFLVRQTWTIHVRYSDAAEGTLVQVSGKTRKRVAEQVADVFQNL